MMKSFFTLLLVAASILVSDANAMIIYNYSNKPALHTVVSSFSDSEHFNVVLDDASSWMTPADEGSRLSLWSADDKIRVAYRKDSGKSDYKFKLVNETKDESVKAMISAYPQNTLTVLSTAKNIKATNKKYEALLDYIPYVNAVKTIRTLTNTGVHDFKVDGYLLLVKGYKNQVILSDGTTWRVEQNFSKFTPGEPVYIGTNYKDGIPGHFFIVGTGKDAKYTFVDQVLEYVGQF